MAVLTMKRRFMVSMTAALFLTVLWQVALAGQDVTGKEQTGETVQISGPSSETATCLQAVALLEQQRSLFNRELGQLKRELALLREDLSKPGLQEIFGGIGYILGLAGIAFFIHCRKTYQRV